MGDMWKVFQITSDDVYEPRLPSATPTSEPENPGRSLVDTPRERVLPTGEILKLGCPHKQLRFGNDGFEIYCDYCGAEWWAACYGNEDDPRCKSGAKGLRIDNSRHVKHSAKGLLMAGALKPEDFVKVIEELDGKDGKNEKTND